MIYYKQRRGCASIRRNLATLMCLRRMGKQVMISKNHPLMDENLMYHKQVNSVDQVQKNLMYHKQVNSVDQVQKNLMYHKQVNSVDQVQKNLMYHKQVNSDQVQENLMYHKQVNSDQVQENLMYHKLSCQLLTWSRNRHLRLLPGHLSCNL